MNCKAIATQLKTKGLIPSNVENKINSESSRADGNVHLLNHLKVEVEERDILEVFRIASEKEGYGKMNTFAAFMLGKLPTMRFVLVCSLHWCILVLACMACIIYMPIARCTGLLWQR